MSGRFTMALAAVAAAAAPALAQSGGDLPAGFFAAHREAYMARMDGGLAIFPAPPEIPRNGDAGYPYRTDSDLWYLTGFGEPGTVAVLRPDAPAGKRYALFVRPRDPARETWTGHRAGVEGAVADYGADLAWPVDSLDAVLGRWLAGVDRVRYDADEDHPWANAEIDSLLDAWKAAAPDSARLVEDADEISDELRLVKGPAEIAALQKAIDATTDAQKAAMAAIRPGMCENQAQAVIEYVFRAEGSPRVGFPSIVGSGPNSTTLHYEENDRRMEKGDVVVMDIGAEWDGYSADVTRTVPVDGTFSPEQAAIYGIVLDAQKAAMAEIRPGANLVAIHLAATRTIVQGLIREGLLEGTVEENMKSRAYRTFFMHGTSHWLGLDVHDVGAYGMAGTPRPVEPGMVFTVEPGIYIARGTEGVDPKWWDIGVRIEDDVVVTDDGYRILSAAAPREIPDVEAAMTKRGLPDVVPGSGSGILEACGSRARS